MDWYIFVYPVILLAIVLVFVMYAIYFERKVIGWIQLRKGPTETGPKGLFQSAADVFKLLIKEDIIPSKADRPLFKLAPILAYVPAFSVLAVIPFTDAPYLKFSNVAVGLMYYLALSSITVMGVLLGGWASNNKYSLLGGMRAGAQMISYEIPLVLSVVGVVMSAGSLNLTEIVETQIAGAWNVFPQFLGFVVFIIAAIAELNRTPFDLPEAESELVAGYHTEYTGFRFAFFMLAEYTYVFAMASLITILFFGGWDAPFGLTFIPPLVWFILKFCCFVFLLFWLRATFPRLRGDQLMEFAWKGLLPLAIINIFVSALLKEVPFLSQYF